MAQIFGFWSDPPAYRAFMDCAHDRIAAAQTGTYDDLRVRVLEQRRGIAAGLPAGLDGSSLLRLAHCQVRERRRDHFIRAQVEVWNPGMAASRGMRGSIFAESAEADFLVLSAWNTAEDHQLYLDERFERLHAAAEADADLDAVTGDVVDLEPGWTVLG
ncbi:hypothetical protein Asi03nite_59510 [Actinoplanes siamensis]|uniref:DUF4937 domain-containing protein n=1 Tax=Actinoplanes siamensis TaxID=1223317 RepID=A0A919NC47_9ACTN|nr:hypothetical protein Asi03nite_59510 [Actinoplanes siamensis]